MTATPGHHATTSSGTLARTFLSLLEHKRLDEAVALLAVDVVYENVTLPTVRGRRAVERVFRPLLGRGGFQVHFHAVGVDEDDPSVVLTERTDMLLLGPVHVQFWVSGRFETRDGQITLWRDCFDWSDILRGTARGLLGAVVPRVRRTWPG
jgi:limonene-1,2-epoxide hydrolase